ncbi:porin [Yoonia sp. BS5-3]|uniref:Porin n=1 Tax=Yoonia phaeophyticola TaxID=3137369 RepID=A0ABZ2V7B8_9RHOB
MKAPQNIEIGWFVHEIERIGRDVMAENAVWPCCIIFPLKGENLPNSLECARLREQEYANARKTGILGNAKTRGKISMKSILLTSTALVAFAGAAAADGHTSITTALTATLGYNDTDSNVLVDDANGVAPGDAGYIDTFSTFDNEYGFYWEGNLSMTATAALDNGLTAGAYFEITVAEDNGVTGDDFGQALSSSDFVISLEAENGGMFFGDTGMAAEKYFSAAGDMEGDGFSTGSDSSVLRFDFSTSTVDVSVSGVADDEDGEMEQAAIGVGATFGSFTLGLGYQAEASGGYVNGSDDFVNDEVFGISGVATFGGAEITLAYAEETDADQQSLGVQVAYPFGPVTATAYFVDEQAATDVDPNYGINVSYSDGPIAASIDYDNDQDFGIWEIEGSYDVGNGLVVGAGYAGDEDENESYFVSAEYDLGGGASFLVSYAEDETGNAEDEIGPDDLQQGTTVELSFAF